MTNWDKPFKEQDFFSAYDDGEDPRLILIRPEDAAERANARFRELLEEATSVVCRLDDG